MAKGTHPCLKVKLMDYWHATATAQILSPDGYGSPIDTVIRTYIYTMHNKLVDTK